MELNRRDFLTVPAAAIPWQPKIRRVRQTNLMVHGPVVLDMEQSGDQWAGLKVDAVMMSVTGILAFYPTLPFARRRSGCLPNGRKVTRVELLRAERQIPFVGGMGTVEFTIPRVLDYEVAALYA